MVLGYQRKSKLASALHLSKIEPLSLGVAKYLDGNKENGTESRSLERS